MDSVLLTFNTGSSTVKIGSFEYDGSSLQKSAKADIDFAATPLNFHMERGKERLDIELQTQESADIVAVLSEVFDKLSAYIELSRVKAIGHRVVHGGDIFAGPALIDDRSIQAIDDLSAYAPLHQPKSLALIKAIRQLFPDILQTASFDTAFHRTMPDVIRRLAIPRAMHDQGIKRYGFHGLSYQSIAQQFNELQPDLGRKKLVVAHLGSGASICALDQGKSVDTSMSFSTLDGIPMATRCGNIDAGVLLHLLSRQNMSADEVTDMLYHRSGLLGVSGISGDCRDLLASDAPEAKQAIDLFTTRIAGEITRQATSLGGVDAVIFTAGIGEHQPEIRARIARKLQWLGLELDDTANNNNAFRITTPSSKIAAFMLATDEEQVIASETLTVLN
ncbi:MULTISPECIES: acetate/propionate family kinase [Brucella/Ochrobactrum group]|nr:MULTISPECIES: acetate/propionate family kinase [Brucella/Ochrobactrum group]PJR87431.1 acetate kinase [Ochrobactrum sp. 721/2009]PJT15678.1 acetate kinase [Ochrobactrum sp. 720/2009]PJT23361.1 acetate kinase [Ochrobactrum sp. 695/2009]PJT23959.1 acetate kinase [Ochrobactrum sp. 715/2009]PJT31837.1 acetate kinase [Ochrobactrum sp. 689/2009]